MSDREPTRGGFTLIEVIGSLVVFAVGVLVVASLSGGLSDQVRDVTQRTEAATLARETLDSLAALPYEELSIGTEESEVELAERTYTRSWEVRAFAPRTLEVVLTVEPPEGDTLRGYVVEPW